MCASKVDDRVKQEGLCMTKQDQTDKQSRPTRDRKPYLKPAFEREKVFETQALTCGKMQTTQASCHQNRKHS